METFVGSTVRVNLDCNLDISGFATKSIRYRKPNGDTGCWTGTLDPTDSQNMYYDTDVVDLDLAGIWYVQAYVEDVGVVRHGIWDTFKVHDILGPCTAAP